MKYAGNIRFVIALMIGAIAGPFAQASVCEEGDLAWAQEQSRVQQTRFKHGAISSAEYASFDLQVADVLYCGGEIRKSDYCIRAKANLDRLKRTAEQSFEMEWARAYLQGLQRYRQVGCAD